MIDKKLGIMDMGYGIRVNGKWISDSRQQITDEGYGIRNKG